MELLFSILSDGLKFNIPPSFASPSFVAITATTVLVSNLFLRSFFIIFKLLKTLSTLAFEKGSIRSKLKTIFKFLNVGMLPAFFRSNTIDQYSSASKLGLRPKDL